MKKQLTILAMLILIAATHISAQKALVINQANGQPLVGAEVKIGDKSYISDRNGNLPDGVISDRAITTYNGIYLNSSSDDNSLIIDFPFTLNKPKKLGTIEGKVLNELDKLISRKQITLSKEDFSYKTTSDRNGYYNFDYLAEGDWSITIEEDNKYQRYFEKLAVDGVTNDTNNHNIIMEEHPPKYGSFEVTIFLEDSIPAIGASVIVIGTETVGIAKQNGKSIIEELKVNEYKIKIEFNGYYPISDYIIIEDGNTLKNTYHLREIIDPSTRVLIDGMDVSEQFTGGFGGNGSDIEVMSNKLVNKTQVGSVSKFSSSSLQRTASGGVVTQSSGVSKSGSGYNTRGASSSNFNNPLMPSTKSSSSKIDNALAPSSPEIEAGSLTSGEVNDFRKWDMWADIAKDKLSQYVGTWGIEPTKRYTVQLTSLDSKPVSDAQVQLISQTGQIIWSSRSDNTGKAELWADAYSLVDDDENGLSIVVNHNNNKQTIKNVTEFKDGINFVRINESCSHSQNVDIVFAMDATGSMGDEIEYLKTELLDIIERLEDVQGDKNLRVGSIFYRDFDYPFNELITTHDLTNNFESVNKFINSQSAISGTSTPEAVEVALSSAVNEFSWSEDAVARIMFLILDAPPHDDPQTLERFRELTARASAMGIRIIPLTASGIGKETEYLMRSLALLTNGTYLFLTDDSGIGGSHIKPTTDSYDVEMMNEMIVRIISQFIDTPNCEDSEDLYTKDIEDNIFNDKEVKDKDIADFIKLYPNPTDGPLTMVLEEKFDNLFVVDMNGKILFRIEPQIGSNQINLSDFPSGVYFLKYSYKGAWGGTQIQLRR